MTDDDDGLLYLSGEDLLWLLCAQREWEREVAEGRILDPDAGRPEPSPSSGFIDRLRRWFSRGR